ncbi:hypothetical protein AAFF_G00026100 [Aldrovandia affinis]|uniref:Uncharacterized protein n=1 Tax=Aldrovandia affinis TaxID=143900 RepID=A0AAD7S5A1_9TELE|nr:hypothetical protein AAFF_G00026100 [Aldrovandia affinis]
MAAVWRWLLLMHLFLLPQFFLTKPFSIVERTGNVTYHLGDHACSSVIGYTLLPIQRLLTNYTEILIYCLRELSGFALSLDLKFIAIGAITMIAIHCLTALVIKTRKLRMTMKELNKLQRDMRTSKTSADSWKLHYEEMKESFGQIKEEAASKAEEYRTTTEAECVRNTNMLEVLKGELVALTNTCEKKEKRLVAMGITCELREKIAAMAVRKLEAELAAMVQLCQEKEAALQQKMAQEEAQQLQMEEYRKRICAPKGELEGGENAHKALVEFHKKAWQIAVKESRNEEVAIKEIGCEQVAMKEGGCDQKDYQSGQAPMQENQHGRGKEDWSGRAEGAGRRGRGQGGWYRPRPRQRQREWMQHCDR